MKGCRIVWLEENLKQNHRVLVMDFLSENRLDGRTVVNVKGNNCLSIKLSKKNHFKSTVSQGAIYCTNNN